MSGRTYVLVHGAFHGGWCWDDVAALLRAGGGTVYTPTLTGLCERAAESTPQTNLTTHVTDVVRLLDEEDLHDVVLVGHSYGGAVITGVAHRRGERLGALVYLDAFVPEDGQSVSSIADAHTPGLTDQLLKIVGADRRLPCIYTVEQFTGWVGERADMLATQLSAQPIETFLEPVKAKGKVAARQTYVYCSTAPLGLFERYADATRHSPAWRYFQLATHHNAMMTMPATVAEIVATA